MPIEFPFTFRLPHLLRLFIWFSQTPSIFSQLKWRFSAKTVAKSGKTSGFFRRKKSDGKNELNRDQWSVSPERIAFSKKLRDNSKSDSCFISIPSSVRIPIHPDKIWRFKWLGIPSHHHLSDHESIAGKPRFTRHGWSLGQKSPKIEKLNPFGNNAETPQDQRAQQGINRKISRLKFPTSFRIWLIFDCFYWPGMEESSPNRFKSYAESGSNSMDSSFGSRRRSKRHEFGTSCRFSTIASFNSRHLLQSIC